MRAEITAAATVAPDWPDEALFDSEEQDEPLAGQDHSDAIDSLSYPLRGRLASPICYVAAELRVHCDPRNLHDYREPDILVALGVADRVRARYEVWVEGKAPDLVIEVLSPSSVENQDLTAKKGWYRRQGVREYVVLDPSGAFAPEPRLQAWRLGDRADGSGDAHRVAAEDEALWSELIPFGFRLVDGELRAVDRASGDVFPAIRDVEPQLRREVALRREAQEQARLALEEVRLAGERERAAAERERLAEERADRETAVRQALEDELARLRQGR